MKRKVIGLTGAFGSGASFIAKNFLEGQGFKIHSLSDILKEKFKKEKGRCHSNRQELQEYGNKLREENIFVFG